MNNRFVKCGKCPAFHLLTDERKDVIKKWESERQKNIDKIRQVRLILVGESMPAKRYFYDLDTDYIASGMRYNLKKEFNQNDLGDISFLKSLQKKGIVLFDCALCPIYLLDSNTEKRHAATHCFLTQNIPFIKETKNVPIATIFPSKRGWLARSIPFDITHRVTGKFGFNDLSGLHNLYLKIENKER